MAKKMLMLILLLTGLQNCSRFNPVSSDEASYSPKDSVTHDVIKNRTENDPYKDTIKTRIIIDTLGDTTKAVDSAEIKFLIDISNGQIEMVKGGLRKTAISIDKLKDLRDYRISVINAVTLQFAPLDEDNKDTLDFNFPVVDGKCATTVVKVPKGYKYEVLVSFWHIQAWPFVQLSFNIYDRSFSALDTVDLTTSSRDTLNLVFFESDGIKFFFELRGLPTGKWTEKSTYSIRCYGSSLSTPTLYKNGALYGYVAMENRRDSTSIWAYAQCDTGMIPMSFLPDITKMIANNGVVTIGADSLFEDWDYTNRVVIPLDNFPDHPD